MASYTIELARAEQLVRLPEIERAAASLFPPGVLPSSLREQTVPVGALRQAQADGRLWVALDHGDEPVGFACVEVVDPTAVLVEIDVDPRHGRQGLGRALVEAVVHWAGGANLEAVELTTFAHIPWNRPFYERLGFRVLETHELSTHLVQTLREEEAEGLRRRVGMRLDLDHP